MMGQNSAIEWTDHTFNPWIGCTKVSDGCKNCYAETLMDKRYGRVKWGPAGTRERTSAANWKKPLSWNRQAEQEGRRYKVFCASLADVFEDRPELYEWRWDLLQLIKDTPHLDWLLLTKRPENVPDMILYMSAGAFHGFEAFDNVWIGTSIENQETANERIPHLLKIPAAVRFLSVEPLLGPVDLWRFGDNENGFGTQWDYRGTYPFYQALGWNGATMIRPGIDWVIVGGESGPKARPMKIHWVKAIRDQCLDSNVPFFFKQWGAWIPEGQAEGLWPPSRSPAIHVWPDRSSSIRYDKKKTGRLLDGREWSQFPDVFTPPD